MAASCRRVFVCVLVLFGSLAQASFADTTPTQSAPSETTAPSSSPGASKGVATPIHKSVEARNRIATSSAAGSSALTDAGASGATTDINGDWCNWALQAVFDGQMDASGVVSGTWSMYFDTTCSRGMYEMSLDANAIDDFNRVWPANGDSCNTFGSPPCSSVVGNGSVTCQFCNGTWDFISGHYMAFWNPIDFSSVNSAYCDTIDDYTVRCFNDLGTSLP